ncbi:MULTISPECIES: hypothetical protein [Vibrio]|uniref:Uncharacterized protein n=1 Tax=Vibrio bivalvicida TaxID=1276888 RepID=A0A177Y0Z9_9VIBR|nr:MULTISPECIES: hypothetical protein [Vibrio]KLN65646.1 hypothetical protein ZX61_08580 [Vibrio sp. VPAP30]OAJ94539.1 hypothetical protein APB76_09475 [Vibrio bivalvicida]
MKALTFLMAFWSSFTIADECASWGCISKIEQLYVSTSGDIYVSTPFNEKLANCTPVSDVYFTLNPSSSNASQVYSALLSAYMSDKRIQMRVVEGHPRCELEYVLLNAANK